MEGMCVDGRWVPLSPAMGGGRRSVVREYNGLGSAPYRPAMTMELALENAVYWEEHGDANMAAGWFAVAVDKEAELKRLGRILAYGFDPSSL